MERLRYGSHCAATAEIQLKLDGRLWLVVQGHADTRLFLVQGLSEKNHVSHMTCGCKKSEYLTQNGPQSGYILLF